MGKKKPTARRALPPLAPGEIDKFIQDAKRDIGQAKADFDYTVALYVLKLKKQKYAERTRLRSGPGKWWRDNLEGVCPWRTARRDFEVYRTFTVPKVEDNFRAFGADALDLAIEYAKDKKISIPSDPRLLTIDFIDDDGNPTTKPFPECRTSELLLAVKGAARKKHPGLKLEPGDKAWLDIACKTLGRYIVSPQKHFVGVVEGDNVFWSLLRISNGNIKAALNDLSQAINDFYASGSVR